MLCSCSKRFYYIEYNAIYCVLVLTFRTKQKLDHLIDLLNLFFYSLLCLFCDLFRDLALVVHICIVYCFVAKSIY